MSVSVSVPYPELQWIRVPRGLAAGVEVTVVFVPHRRGRQYGDLWERRLVVPGFESSRSPNTAVVEKRTFDLPPGRYRVRVYVDDVNSEESSEAAQDVEVPDYSRVPVGFADLDLGVADSMGAFTPVPTRRYGMNTNRLAARVTLFDRRPGEWPRHYAFRYHIRDDDERELLSGTTAVALARSAEPVVVRPTASELFLGRYVFEVELAEGRQRWRVERSFEVEESGPPRGKEFERMLEPLAYIADPAEIDHLRSLPEEQQAAGWEEFWRRRDPTPETSRNEAMLEFFRRVRYTEQHFQGFGPGWRSDMGRIYIKFGPPDQIETRPATSQTPAFEVWYYNQPYRRFVFTDREGFGRFVLVNPSVE
jgi:GWxTD domain-containing protein